MSRSNNIELVNPAKRYYEWNGDSGGFRFFDKSKGDKGEKVQVPLPFRFMVLDTLSTIKGFNKEENSGYWSNEIRSTKKEILIVRNKNGVCSSGLYENVMADKNCKGAKYVQSVYIAFKELDGLIIANIQMMGAALGAWIDFRKKNKNILEGAISVNNMIEGKNGKTIYKIPVFEKIPITNESDIEAKHLDAELQNYLDAYFKKNNQEIDNNVEEIQSKSIFDNEKIVKSNEIVSPNDDLPF